MNNVLVIFILVTMPIFAKIYIKANQTKGYKASKLYNLSIATLVIASGCYLALYFFPIEILVLPWKSRLISVGVGILIGVISYSVGISAKQEIKKGDANQLITSGVFARIRHPWAFNELTCFFMLAFLVNSGFLVVLSLLWIPVFVFVCKDEEKHLVDKFGQGYLTYKNRSGFMLPSYHLSTG